MYKRIQACMIYSDLYKSCINNIKEKQQNSEKIDDKKCKRYLDFLKGNLCTKQTYINSDMPISER